MFFCFVLKPSQIGFACSLLNLCVHRALLRARAASRLHNRQEFRASEAEEFDARVQRFRQGGHGQCAGKILLKTYAYNANFVRDSREFNGKKWNGMDWNGMEWIGMELFEERTSGLKFLY